MNRVERIDTTYKGVTIYTLTRVRRCRQLAWWCGTTSTSIAPRRLTWLSHVDCYGVTGCSASIHRVSISSAGAVNVTQSHQMHWREPFFLLPILSPCAGDPHRSLATGVIRCCPVPIHPQNRSSSSLKVVLNFKPRRFSFNSVYCFV
jgi:hypothetical protein